MRVIGLCLLLSGCQCFVPVEEARDAGPVDGGSRPSPDAGLSQDAGAECRQASDCTPPAMIPFCQGQAAACVDGRCLVECTGSGRTCTSAQEPCYACTPGGQQCGNCGLTPSCSMTVTGAGCPAPFTSGARVQVVPFSGRCGGALVLDGGFVGTWFSIDGATSFHTIPALGGTCLGSDLFTGVPRTFISCPACSFVGEGCE
jgi:hypothetical protein